MKVIKVQYTVKPEYVEENKKKIQAVMEELRALNNPNVKYLSSILEDGKSFLHVVMYNSEEAENLPASLESFKNFQSSLKDNLEVPPKAEKSEVVDSSYDIF